MMTSRFKAFMPFIFKWEGGYVNDPDDRGGETKYGIDKRSHPKEDIKNLTKARAMEIYFNEYWTPSKAEQLPLPLGEVVMNISVNSGLSRAARFLQEILGVTVDGIVGPKTLAAAKRDPLNDVVKLLDRQEKHYRTIGVGSQAKFLKGWLNRNNDLRKWIVT